MKKLQIHEEFEVKNLILNSDVIPPVIFDFSGRFRIDVIFYTKERGKNVTYFIGHAYYTIKRAFKVPRRSRTTVRNKN
jgi:hypothetical protein